VGYTPEYTIGVWAGNFDGRATYQLSGSEGAGKVFGDVVRGLYGKSNPGLHLPPEGVVQAEVCSHSGLKPTPQCRSRVLEWFKKGTEPIRPCTFHNPESELHRLPNRYANWIHEFQRKGIDSPFVLASQTNRELESDPDRIEDPPTEAGATGSPATRGDLERIQIGSAPLEKLTPAGAEAGEIRILYPLDHDRFVLDQPGSPGTIPLRAQVMDPDPEVTWFLNGVELEKAGPPYSIAWKMEKGAHTLSVVGSEGFADSVRVVVE
jgi:membrane carboxypeptidase/penicillin-binding protein PbpC